MLASSYQGKSFTIHIGDCHGEYSLPDPDKRPMKGREGGWLSINTIWDGYRIMCMLENAGMPEGDAETALASLAAHFPQAVRDGMIGDDGHGYVHEIYGDKPALEWAFRTFYESLLEGGPSGDDDVFDYWPNAMEMAREFARSLDAIEGTEGTPYMNEFRDAYRTFVREGGRVMEYSFDGDDFEDNFHER